MPSFVALIGTQFGDEGKGKLIDFLSHDFDYVVRYQGGDNAGHTINIDGNKYILKLIPSGIFQTKAIIAPGTIVNPITLLQEIDSLSCLGNLSNKLFVSDLAHVIFDFHIEWDKLCEKIRGKHAIYSTYRGIGPCYSDKSARFGVRICDLMNYECLVEKLKINLELKNPLFAKFGLPVFDAEVVAKKYYELGQKIKPFLINYYDFFLKETSLKKKFLFEGSQGMLLDLDCGTYPYVTSSNIVGSLMHGAYLSPHKINRIIGIVKCYATRVGNGEFITELDDKKLTSYIQEVGHEYGSVTGRPRRIGWLDLVSVKYSLNVSGVTEIALTLVDVLNNLDEIKVCVGYEENNAAIDSDMPCKNNKISPVYKTFSSWDDDFENIKKYDDFSDNLKTYIKFLEDFLSLKITFISFGRDRQLTVER